jgi:hypothetical protein
VAFLRRNLEEDTEVGNRLVGQIWEAEEAPELYTPPPVLEESSFIPDIPDIPSSFLKVLIHSQEWYFIPDLFLVCSHFIPDPFPIWPLPS